MIWGARLPGNLTAACPIGKRPARVRFHRQGRASLCLCLLLALSLGRCGSTASPSSEVFEVTPTPAWGDSRGNAAIGQQLALKYCRSCHLVAGKGKALPGAPPFEITARKAGINAAYLRRWLQDPGSIKPGTLMPNLDLSEGDIEHFIAFLYGYRDRAEDKSGKDPTAADQ